MSLRFANVNRGDAHWSLQRNCSVTPKQLGCVYAMSCLTCGGVGVFFWLQGAALVLPFAVLELFAVGCAFVMYARHATDGEKISLHENRLVVEIESAGKLNRTEFHRSWVRIEPPVGGSSLIELSEKGKSIRVGRYVRPELRLQLANEIRAALRAA